MRIAIRGEGYVADRLRELVSTTRPFVLTDRRPAFTIELQEASGRHVEVDTPDGPFEQALFAQLRQAVRIHDGAGALGELLLIAGGGNQDPRVLAIGVPRGASALTLEPLARALWTALCLVTRHGQHDNWWDRVRHRVTGLVPAFAVLACFLASTPSAAQTSQVTFGGVSQPVTIPDPVVQQWSAPSTQIFTLDAVAERATVDVTKYAGVLVQVAGTYAGATITFAGGDAANLLGVVWCYGVVGDPLSELLLQDALTDNSSVVYTCVVPPGVSHFHLELSALTSGSLTVTITASARSAAALTMQYVALRDNLGVAFGTPTNPVRATVTATNLDIRDLNSAADSVTAFVSTVPANQTVNVTQFAGTPIVTGLGPAGADIPRVTASLDALTYNAPAAATVGVASAQVLAANTSRKFAVFTNTSANKISCAVAAAAVIDSGITLAPWPGPGHVWRMGREDLATGAVNCIASAAGSNLAIQQGQ